jgi:hypothetical protein
LFAAASDLSEIGSGIRAIPLKGKAPTLPGLAEVDAVALSHLQADHFIDMCSFWVART